MALKLTKFSDLFLASQASANSYGQWPEHVTNSSVKFLTVP